MIAATPCRSSLQIRYQDVEDLAALEQVRRRASASADVAFAAHYYLQDGPLVRIPDDPESGAWDTSAPAGNNWSLEFVNAPAAWDIKTGDRAVKVAVIDGDLDRDHGDLVFNVDGVFGERTEEWGGHGTHVAGMICGDSNNGKGISGVAWDCGLLLYEIELDKSSPVWVQQQMVDAVDAGARIVNMSMQFIDNNQCGTAGTDETRQKVLETNAILGYGIEYAIRQGKDVLWVFAAGNECREAIYASLASLTLHYPDNTIAVASIDQSGGVSSFSNGGSGVEISAPGSGIYSSLPQACRFGGGLCADQFGEMSGTSIAAPLVTGVVVLVRSAHPGITAAQVKQCLVFSRTGDFWVIDAEKTVLCGA